ncbi:MAG: alanyl-tRNA editing protein [Chloroflexi bacterium]|nr:alanyl-tRNA editing protein [Chloroflexota bacterium]
MMNHLFYEDPYLDQFEAQIVEHTVVNSHPAVVLSQTAFYPTGGGQPHDMGTLNATPVIDVVKRDDDAVLHILAAPLATEHVHGRINWRRRFDHMRHHTGQHILSRAFIEVAAAATIGFHVSDNSVTIDLDRRDLSEGDVDAAEDLANQIVAQNRPVTAWFPDADTLTELPIRKISEKVSGPVRVVDIEGFDVTACGGTHVAHTAEIGLIKVVRTEKIKGNYLRVEFVCGDRALMDYRHKNRLLLSLANDLTTAYDQIPEAFDKLRDENKSLKKSLRAVRQQLLAVEAETLLAADGSQSPHNRLLTIARVYEDYEPRDLQQLAARLTEEPGVVALLGRFGDPAHFVFARSDDVGLDMVPHLHTAIEQLGSRRGGGRPELAQGGGVPASREAVQAAIDTVLRLIEIKRGE